jgi:AcrR family transcriptional regulator
MQGRRATLRAHLLTEIRAAALDELRQTGAAALSLREVARRAGISPAGLYRYVDGRDGLLELLISDGFEAFGAAIEAAIAAAGDDVEARLEAIALGYRRWALDNPEQFGLILGTPVPGFRARADGPTEASVRRFADPMIREVVAAYAASRHTRAAGEAAPVIDLAAFDPTTGGVPDSLLSANVRSWGRVHGLVSLEVFGHLTWSGADVEALLRTEVRSIIAELHHHTVTAP